MEDKIKLEVEKINTILSKETPYDDWHKGRHSALRGVKVALELILNEAIVKQEKACATCKYYKPDNNPTCSECFARDKHVPASLNEV